MADQVVNEVVNTNAKSTVLTAPGPPRSRAAPDVELGGSAGGGTPDEAEHGGEIGKGGGDSKGGGDGKGGAAGGLGGPSVTCTLIFWPDEQWPPSYIWHAM